MESVKVQDVINLYKKKVDLIRITDINKTRQIKLVQSVFDMISYPLISDLEIVQFTILQDVLYILVNDLSFIKY